MSGQGGAVAPRRHDLARLFKVDPGVHISNMTGQSGHLEGDLLARFVRVLLYHFSIFSTAAKHKSSQKSCWFVVRSIFEIFCSLG